MSNEFDPDVTYYLCQGLAPAGGILSNGTLVWADDKEGYIVNGELVDDDGKVLGRIDGLTLTLEYEPSKGRVTYELIPKEEF